MYLIQISKFVIYIANLEIWVQSENILVGRYNNIF